MIKSQELRSSTSCLNKAEPDEMIFVLRSHDPLFAPTIRLWAAMAVGVHEQDKLYEAYLVADFGEKQHAERNAPTPLTQNQAQTAEQAGIVRGRGLVPSYRARDPHDPSYDPGRPIGGPF